MASLPSCAQHDYLEIACLHQYRVRIQLKDGRSLVGRALDLQTTFEKHEFLIIDRNGKEPLETNHLKKLEVLSSNALFKEIDF